jgi:hypothetical protein
LQRSVNPVIPVVIPVRVELVVVKRKNRAVRRKEKSLKERRVQLNLRDGTGKKRPTTTITMAQARLSTVITDITECMVGKQQAIKT